MDAYAQALGVQQPKGPPPGAGNVMPWERRPDTMDGSPSDIAELKAAIKSAPNKAATDALTQELVKKQPANDPYAAALGIQSSAQKQATQPVAQQAATSRPSTPEEDSVTASFRAAEGAKQPAQTPSWWDKIRGASEAAGDQFNTAAGVAVGAPLGFVNGVVQNVGHLLMGSKESPGSLEDYTKQGAEQGINFAKGGSMSGDRQPAALSPTGQQYTEAVGNFVGSNAPALFGMPHGPAIPAKTAISDIASSARSRALNGVVGDIPVQAAVKPRFRYVDGKWQEVDAQAAAAAATASPTASVAKPAQQGAPAATETLTPIKLQFDESAPIAESGKTLPQAEQTRRAEVLKSVGITNARKSALTGDANAASTDLQLSKLDSPAGNLMKSQLTAERETLVNHADSLVKKTGGSEGLDESALYSRGSNIIAPLDDLKKWYDTRTSQLYKVADERAQGVPTELETFRKVLGDDSELTNSDRVHLRDAIGAYAKKLGIVDENGNVFSNAQQAETLRKKLNEDWSPANSRFVGKLKDALDEDVTKAAGEDVYAEARKMRASRGATLDNPNGIAKLMDSSGPEGINRAVAVEKIPVAVTSMPIDQLTHVVDVLKNAPAEIQPKAAQAVAEIRAQFANKIREEGGKQAGQWNAKGVSKYLNANAERMKLVFTPEELADFRNLNDAGNILSKDQSYPGAAVQERNIVRSGVAKALPAIGASIGSIVGPAGSAVGALAGSKGGAMLEEAGALRSAKKRLTPLSEVGK